VPFARSFQNTVTADLVDADGSTWTVTFETDGPIPEHGDELPGMPFAQEWRGGWTVAWVCHDPYGFDCWDGWDDPSTPEDQWTTGVFRDFRTSHDGGGELARDEFVADMVESFGRDRVFVVDVYSHGAEHYSVSNTTWYPDRQWDVAPACVYVAPADVTDPRAFAQGMMATWTSYVNGDVWNVVQSSIEVNPDTGEATETDVDVVGGYIGYDHAVESARYGL